MPSYLKFTATHLLSLSKRRKYHLILKILGIYWKVTEGELAFLWESKSYWQTWKKRIIFQKCVISIGTFMYVSQLFLNKPIFTIWGRKREKQEKAWAQVFLANINSKAVFPSYLKKNSKTDNTTGVVFIQLDKVRNSVLILTHNQHQNQKWIQLIISHYSKPPKETSNG